MFKRTKISLALVALGSTLSVAAQAQDVQRVEVTGSAVRRIDAESALPVLVLRAADIQKSGATSTVDLLRKLPSIQGSTGESASVGGTTFGFSGVSIHNVGETRTLVLLNGHRLAIFGGQTLTGFAAGFDLNAIPVSAIERVEVLTDGASALYGADAIAGVVNFITKRDSKDGDLTVGLSEPKGGAKEKRFSISKGFGSLDKDNFNAFLAFAHDERTKLDSVQRDFAATGRVFFSANGKNYRYQQFSANAIPANVDANYDPVTDYTPTVSPYRIVNGKCPPKSFRVIDGQDDYCGFDFVGELEIYPVRKRDSALASLTTRVGEHELRADLLLSRTKQTSRIAPVPGPLSIPAGSALANKYLVPLGITEDTTAYYRLYDLGKRTNDDTADFLDLSLSSRGTFAGFDYEAGFTHSESKVKSNISGYPGALALGKLRASGLLDPFVLPGQQTAASQAAINGANYNGYWDGGTSKLDTLGLRGSREIAKTAAGAVQLAAGLNFNREQVSTNPSLFAQGKLADPVTGTLCDGTKANPCDTRFGDKAAKPPYSASRNAYGLFAEVVVPVMKNLEVSGAVRHDHYADFGNADTAKASFRWTPTPQLLFRGSVGTGFHAPTVQQVSAPTQSYGVTSDKYSCSDDLKAIATSLGAVCRSSKQQYDQFAGGNTGLKPEKSIQGTLGFRVEPTREFSFGVDLWHVGIHDAFGQITEQTAFAKPLVYAKSFTTTIEPGTNKVLVAFLADNKNLGNAFSTGLDFDVSGKFKTPIGALDSHLTATYMVREDQQVIKNGPYYSAIGNNNANLGVVTFRYQGRWANSLTTGAFTNTLGVNFKSGYYDQTQTADVLDANGNVVGSEKVQLKIGDYMTFDWQTKWDIMKNLSLSAGALNLFDKRPPFTLSTSGTNKGQQFGYDDRYYDPRGRTLYANVTYQF
jgi:iron complex outermembrane receptor protein